MGNLVVFPKFFSTYFPKVTRSGNGPAMSLKSRLTKRHAESSASWLNAHSTSNIVQDHTKLNDNTQTPTTFPSNGGRGPLPVLSTTLSGYKSEHDSMGSDDDANTHNDIRKTVRVDQGVERD